MKLGGWSVPRLASWTCIPLF